MAPLVEETTGLYGITREALRRYQCRIGRRPYVHIVSKFEAVDINTEEDFRIAEYVDRLFGIYHARAASFLYRRAYNKQLSRASRLSAPYAGNTASTRTSRHYMYGTLNLSIQGKESLYRGYSAA